MAEPMKIRTTLKGDLAEVRVLMVHPMETGQRKDADGNIVPTHFIQEVTVKVNGKTMLDGQISQAVSRNPVFSFRLKGVTVQDTRNCGGLLLFFISGQSKNRTCK